MLRKEERKKNGHEMFRKEEKTGGCAIFYEFTLPFQSFCLYLQSQRMSEPNKNI